MQLILCGFILHYCALSVLATPLDVKLNNPYGRNTSSEDNETLSTVQAVLNDDEKCGFDLVNKFRKAKIVGGQSAKYGENPWQVSLQRLNWRTNRYDHFCGGSLINKRWVLTAAHCVVRMDKSTARVALGAHNLQRLENAHLAGINRVFYHEKYDSRTVQNDIALLELDQNVDLSRKSTKAINAICLPGRKQKFSGDSVVSGWGRLSSGGPSPNELQQVTVKLIDGQSCTRYYGSMVRSGMICAGYPEGGRDGCQGDSGGPLIKRDTKPAVLVGIVSWGIGCASPGKPGVYTEVADYTDWIGSKMRL